MHIFLFYHSICNQWLPKMPEFCWILLRHVIDEWKKRNWEKVQWIHKISLLVQATIHDITIRIRADLPCEEIQFYWLAVRQRWEASLQCHISKLNSISMRQIALDYFPLHWHILNTLYILTIITQMHRMREKESLNFCSSFQFYKFLTVASLLANVLRLVEMKHTKQCENYFQ
jgi:hypothetical protein